MKRCVIGRHVYKPASATVFRQERIDGTIEVGTEVKEACCFCSKVRVRNLRGVWNIKDDELVLDPNELALIIPARHTVDSSIITKAFIVVMLWANYLIILFLIPLTIWAVAYAACAFLGSIYATVTLWEKKPQ